MKFESQEEFIKYIDEHMHDPFIDPWEKDPNAPYGYIYKTTDLRNGKIYIGKHKADKFEYMDYSGSGKFIPRIRNKYGLGVLEVDLVAWYENLEELNKAERYWIKYYDSKDPKGYNILDGGDGGDVSVGMTEDEYNEWCRKVSIGNKGKIISKETREKISIAIKNSMTEERIEQMRSRVTGEGNPRYGVHLTDSEKKNLSEKFSGEGNPFYGKTHSEETKRKLSKGRTGDKNPGAGKVWMTDGESNKRVLPVDINVYISKGWWKGRTVSQSTRDKCRENSMKRSRDNNGRYQ